VRDLIPLAERGIEPTLANSHPEERDGHHDGLLAVIDHARAALAKLETEGIPRPARTDCK